MAVAKNESLDGPPSHYDTRQKDMFLRTLPFLALALTAELSLALPPGPASTTDTIISLVLLCLTAMSFLLPWHALPDGVDIIIPLLYVGSALALILAAGGSSTGVGLIVLLPILWAALNIELWQSLLVVIAVVVVEYVTTYLPDDLSDSVRIRRVVSWLAIGALMAYVIHDIRARIARISAQREQVNVEMAVTISQLNERNRATSILSSFVERLSFCDVIDEAYRVISSSADDMFQVGGAISILGGPDSQLSTKCHWRDFDIGTQPFGIDDCLAMKQGSPFESRLEGPRCAHLDGASAPFVLCQPLHIKNEKIGVLTVSLSHGREQSRDAELIRQYADLLSDQISIWMANFNLRESLKNLSIRDPLTNLYNRRFMLETLNREMSITARNDEHTSIIQMDVDHFKLFNDSFGHEVGDSVLQAVADVMMRLFRDSDVPCRSGGEEFTMILPRCSWETANARAAELQTRVSRILIPAIDADVAPKPPTLSIGIATSPEHGITSKDLLRAADKALYAAKAEGRDRIVKASQVVPAVPILQPHL
jgi:diguanylate cyclase (GGDEF)-like protein